MKKQTLLLILILVSIFDIAAAQTTLITKTEPGESIVTGSVKDRNGNFLRYAFIQDKQTKSRTYSDSTGNFIIRTTPNAALFINCTGFRDTVIRLNGQVSLSVVLTPAAVGATTTVDAATSNTSLLQRNLSDQMNLNSQHLSTIIQQGSILSEVHEKTETQGSNYLYRNWVHGYVTNAQDSLVQNPQFLFNYDKITGSLLLTQDNHTMIAVDKDKVKSFTLFDSFNQPHTFAQVPGIDNNLYVEVIADGAKYRICKLIKTKFIPSNYKTNGITSTGNNYDEYQDDATYYVVDAKTGQAQKISLKKKALKQAFGADQNKANDYLQAHDGNIDDSYLQGLGDSMNK